MHCRLSEGEQLRAPVLEDTTIYCIVLVHMTQDFSEVIRRVTTKRNGRCSQGGQIFVLQNLGEIFGIGEEKINNKKREKK